MHDAQTANRCESLLPFHLRKHTLGPLDPACSLAGFSEAALNIFHNVKHVFREVLRSRANLFVAVGD